MNQVPNAVQLILRNRTRQLSHAERALIGDSISETRTVAAGTTVVRQSQPLRISTLLMDGLMARRLHSMDGRRHQVAIHVPGDFVDLHAYPLKHLDHDVSALTPVTFGIVTHDALDHLLAEHPTLVKTLWYLTLIDAAMHRQWIFRGSSLSALERVAHFICEMYARLLAIGAADAGKFALPLTQGDIGEVCGLTNVHVNRVVRQLREADLCIVRSTGVEIVDLPGLVACGHFDPSYLYLNDEMQAHFARSRSTS